MALPPPLRGARGSARSTVPCSCLQGQGTAASPPLSRPPAGVSAGRVWLGTPSKGILGNVAPADPCGHTTQPPGVVGCFLFFGVLLHFTGA